MDDLAAEVLDPGELGRVALVVAVVAAAVHEEEAAGQRDRLRRRRCAPRVDGPARLLARPRRASTTRWPKRILRSIPASRAVVAHVVEDRGAVGDRLRLGPGPEAVAERVHVGVGADPGVAEEVPGAADRPRAPRGSRSSCPGSAPAGGGRRRCRRGRHRRSARRGVQRHSAVSPGQAWAGSSTWKAIPARLQSCEKHVTHRLQRSSPGRRARGSSSKARQSADSASIFEVSP